MGESLSSRHVIAVAAGALGATAFAFAVGPRIFLAGDTVQYLKMTSGLPAEAPFAYRVLVPAIARCLPWNVAVNFLLVTLLSTVGTLVASYCLFRTTGVSHRASLVSMVLLGLSYPVSFYLGYFALVDPLASGLTVLGLLLALRGHCGRAALTATAGVFAKETVLLLLPVMFLCALRRRHDLRGAARAALLCAAPLACWLLLRGTIVAAEGPFAVHGWAGMLGLWKQIWGYNSGGFGIGLRLGREFLRSYGFYWALAALGLASLRWDLRFVCLYFLGAGVLLCGLATDWSRMLGTAFPGLFLAVAAFADRLGRKRRGDLAAVALLALGGVQSYLALLAYGELPAAGRIALVAGSAAVFAVGWVIALAGLKGADGGLRGAPRMAADGAGAHVPARSGYAILPHGN